MKDYERMTKGGVVYELAPAVESESCTGCAFADDGDMCGKQGVLCYEHDQIWKEVKVDKTIADYISHMDDTKPTNPKDVVGVRKAPMSTVPAQVLAEVGLAMLEGACKYGRHNFRAVGVRNSVYYDGTMRHLMAWWEGEDIDPDSGVSHITKAIASLVVLRDAMMNGLAEDDRPPSPKPFYPTMNDQAAALLDKHAGKNPRHYTIKDPM